MKQTILVLIIATISFSFTSDKPAYLLFDKTGEEIQYSKMLEELEKADIVFFGELHTDPIAHWLQFELTKDLFDEKKQDLVIGAEMFEADNQLIMDEYLAGYHQTKKFEAEIRLWGNYKTDYKPVVEFAKENQLKYIATNIPRRYASIVHKKGFEGLEKLSEEAKKYIAPLPINYDPEVNCYKEMLNMSMGMGMKNHVNENFPKSQAIKDATMAHFILNNWEKGKLFFHFNGSYHSNNFEGIVWHLNQKQAELKILTIAIVMQEDVSKLTEENLNVADYIICVDENMTQTNR